MVQEPSSCNHIFAYFPKTIAISLKNKYNNTIGKGEKICKREVLEVKLEQ